MPPKQQPQNGNPKKGKGQNRPKPPAKQQGKQQRQRPQGAQQPRRQRFRIETRQAIRAPYEATVARHLSRVITLPGETRPVRFPIVASGIEKTAVLPLRELVNLDWTPPPPDPALRSLVPTVENQMFMLTYSPIVPVWTWKVENTHRYRFTCEGNQPGDNDAIEPSNGLVMSQTEDYVPWMVHPKSNVWFAYVPPGHPFAITAIGFESGTAPCGLELSLTTIVKGHVSAPIHMHIPLAASTAATTVTTFNVSVDAWKGRGSWINIVQVRPTGSAKYGPASAGCRLTVDTTAMSGWFPMMMTPDMRNVLPLLTSARTNAASLLITNTSPELYMNGTVVGGQIKSAESDVFNIEHMKSKLETLNRELKYDGKARDGIYSYLPPNSKSALDFTDYAPSFLKVSDLAGKDERQAALIYWEDFERVNVIRFTSNPEHGLTFKVRFDTHLEFATNSQIFSLQPAKLSPDQFSAMVLASASMVPFTENPLHVGQLAYLSKMLFDRFMPYAAPHLRQALKNATRAADDWLASY